MPEHAGVRMRIPQGRISRWIRVSHDPHRSRVEPQRPENKGGHGVFQSTHKDGNKISGESLQDLLVRSLDAVEGASILAGSLC